MSCGLKKTNTNTLGGVHLTERTCSPYNPIIKLMVDDCLGLPVYPVTSVDAVIDEDGNTIRKLFADLWDAIMNNLGSISEILDKIQEILSEIENFGDYATSELLSQLQLALGALQNTLTTLRTWVLEISRCGDYNRTEGQETLNPTIVQYVLDLKSQIESFFGDEEGSEGPTYQALVNLVESIAKCEGNDIYNPEPRPNIVAKVLDLIERYDNMDKDLKKCAHLDLNILDYNVKKLDADEYPVSAAKFISLYYTLYDAIKEYHKLSEGKKMYIYVPVGTLIGVERGDLPDYDYNENGMIDFQDVDMLRDGIETSPPNSFTISTGDTDVDGSDGVNISDINALINIILRGNNTKIKSESSYNWDKYIYEITKEQNQSGNFSYTDIQYYFPEAKIIAHPLIPGKLYVNLITNTAYIYKENSTQGTMTPLYIEETECEYIGSKTDVEYIPGKYYVYENTYDVIPACALQVELEVGLSYDENYKFNPTATDVTAMITAWGWIDSNTQISGRPVHQTLLDLKDLLTCDDNIKTITIGEYEITVDPNNPNDQLLIELLGEIKGAVERGMTNQESFPESMTFYYLGAGGEVTPGTVTSPYYIKLALLAMYDINNDGVLNITDINLIIAVLLGQTEAFKPNVNTIMLNTELRYGTADSNVGYTTDFSYPTGKLIRVTYDSSTQPEFKYDWWYVDESNMVRPLNPVVRLRYDVETNKLASFYEGVLTSEAIILLEAHAANKLTGTYQLASEPLQVINMGENSNPFMFGTYTGENELYNGLQTGNTFVFDDSGILERLDYSLFGAYNVFAIPWVDEGHKLYTQTSEELQNLFDSQNETSILIYLNDNFESVLDELYNQPTGAKVMTIESTEYDIDMRYDTAIKVGGGYLSANGKILLVKKTFNLVFALDDYLENSEDPIEDYISWEMELKVEDSMPIDTDCIYYFPKYGLQLRFERVSFSGELYYKPIVVNVEHSTALENPTVLMPNTYPVFNSFPELDFARFLLIPGSEQIEIKGIIKTPDPYDALNDFGDEFMDLNIIISETPEIEVTSTLPLADTRYEYTVSHGILRILEL